MGVVDDMHDDEIRARLGLRPLGRAMTMEERIEVNALRSFPEPFDPDTASPVCICEHEPHGGECAELVRGIVGLPWPCGCDEYCPNREEQRLSDPDTGEAVPGER